MPFSAPGAPPADILAALHNGAEGGPDVYAPKFKPAGKGKTNGSISRNSAWRNVRQCMAGSLAPSRYAALRLRGTEYTAWMGAHGADLRKNNAHSFSFCFFAQSRHQKNNLAKTERKRRQQARQKRQAHAVMSHSKHQSCAGRTAHYIAWRARRRQKLCLLFFISPRTVFGHKGKNKKPDR